MAVKWTKARNWNRTPGQGSRRRCRRDFLARCSLVLYAGSNSPPQGLAHTSLRLWSLSGGRSISSFLRAVWGTAVTAASPHGHLRRQAPSEHESMLTQLNERAGRAGQRPGHGHSEGQGLCSKGPRVRVFPSPFSPQQTPWLPPPLPAGTFVTHLMSRYMSHL